MSDPVGRRADGVEGEIEGAGEGLRVQGTRRAESCVGFVESRIQVWVLFGRGHERPWRGYCPGQITPRLKAAAILFAAMRAMGS
jgi:hypothetical protein